jgi:Ca2+:H+ antiporter
MTFGTCLLLGTISESRDTYPIVFARTNAQLLVVSLISIILPTAFATWSEDAHSEGHSSLVSVSHGCAIVLLLEFVSYSLYCYFIHIRDRHLPINVKSAIVQAGLFATTTACAKVEPEGILRKLRKTVQDSKPRYPVYIDILILIPGVVAQVFTSLYILEALESSAKTLHLSHSFVGLVMIPLILSSVELITAAIRSRKEGPAWVSGLAFGSCIRITLFVFPVAVLFGWIADMPGVTMIFDGFQVTILALTILLVNHVIQNQSLQW